MLPVLALALLCQSRPTFGFKGGSEYELCTALEAVSHTPVAFFCGRPEAIKALKFDYDSPADLERLLQVKLQLTETKRSWGFAHKDWPESFYKKQNTDWHYLRLLKDSKDFKCEQLPGGLLDVDSGMGVIALTDLRDGLQPMMLSWNRFFDNARLVLIAHRAKPSDVLKSVASALGAKLTTSEGRARLDLDIPEYRRRTIAMCDKSPAETYAVPAMRRIDAADLNYLKVEVSLLSDSIIRQCMDGNAGPFEYAPGTPIFSAAMQRAKIWSEDFVDQPGWHVHSDLSDRIKTIDVSLPVDVEFRADGLVVCSYSVDQNRVISF